MLEKQVPALYQVRMNEVAPGKTEQDAPGVTFRAVLAGGLISLFIGVSLPYTNMIIKGALLAHNFNTPAALFMSFLFIGIVNVVLGLMKRSWTFAPAELAVVYIMAMLATSIPTIGFSEYLLPIIAGFYYYASPENKWESIFHGDLPDWLAPNDPVAVRYFYEGLPEGRSLPWGAWIEPILYWCLFIIAVYWVSACIMVILRKQWMEREKLLYPLIQVPLEMIQDDAQRSRIKPFFRSPVYVDRFLYPLPAGQLQGPVRLLSLSSSHGHLLGSGHPDDPVSALQGHHDAHRHAQHGHARLCLPAQP